ncbi:hypothetical protein RKD37_003545 [Streptomyces ambofaciens]
MVPERETTTRERATSGATASSRARARLDQPRAPRRRLLPEWDPESFGRLSERVARFLGTGRFIVWMTVVIILWVVWNVSAPSGLRFDEYPFIFLTLMLSLQASYAAPADPARAEPAGRPGPGQPGAGPQAERAVDRGHRVPDPGDRRPAHRARRGRDAGLDPLRVAGPRQGPSGAAERPSRRPRGIPGGPVRGA